MSHPDFLICLECEAPCYVFEYQGDKLQSALCTTCGNEDPTQFATEAEFEEMSWIPSGVERAPD